MTSHELLNFLVRQRQAYEQHFPERRGVGSWPTRQETLYNLNLNKGWFPNDRGPMAPTFNAAFRHLRNHGLLEQRACTRACHARHIIVTAKGLAQLAKWKAEGCDWCGDHERRLDKISISTEEVAS